MVKVIIHGAAGYMGRVLTELIEAEEGVEVAAGIDIAEPNGFAYPFFTKPSDCNVEADVLIDFSVAKATDALLDFCEDRKVPSIICTTGLSDDQLKRIKAISSKVPMLRSANMSIGVNTIIDMLKTYSKVFTDAGFDVEIFEKHHNRKLDSPSGTALALADAVNVAHDGRFDYEYNRSGRMAKRGSDELGIVSMRGGNIVGEHEVFFAGIDEVITIKHTATSRGVFAKGAIQAAKFLAKAKPGMYSMADVIAE